MIDEKELWSNIAFTVSAALNHDIKLDNMEAVHGGDINQCFKCENILNGEYYFVKLNSIDQTRMFACEQYNLEQIQSAGEIATPRVIARGESRGYCFLVLEFVELNANGNEAELGLQLAKLHRHSQDFYGFKHDNFIGTSNQLNTPTKDWCDFWIDMRIKPQLSRAYTVGYSSALKAFEKKLYSKLVEVFADYSPIPSLLHGDLWGGNKAFKKNKAPIIYDPASYYGDRETDIALTELFGGFSPAFYQSYNQEWPLDYGYKIRKNVYNLYHYLNHLNLFGSSYLKASENTIQTILNT